MSKLWLSFKMNNNKTYRTLTQRLKSFLKKIVHVKTIQRKKINDP